MRKGYLSLEANIVVCHVLICLTGRCTCHAQYIVLNQSSFIVRIDCLHLSLDLSQQASILRQWDREDLIDVVKFFAHEDL